MSDEAREVEPQYEYRVVAEWPGFKGDYSLPITYEAATRRLPVVKAEFPDGDVYIERRTPWERIGEADLDKEDA